MKLLMSLVMLNSINVFAAEATIQGVWKMDNWQVISKSGDRAEFCRGGHGYLIYEPSGIVSTSINCPAKKDGVTEPADKFERKFFYAGIYTVEDGLITKQVSNASAEALIGKTVLRYIEKVTDQELILSGPFGEGSLYIRWTK